MKVIFYKCNLREAEEDEFGDIQHEIVSKQPFEAEIMSSFVACAKKGNYTKLDIKGHSNLYYSNFLKTDDIVEHRDVQYKVVSLLLGNDRSKNAYTKVTLRSEQKFP